MASGVPAREPVAAAYALPPGAQALRLQRVRRPVHHEEQLQASRRGACRPEVQHKINPDPNGQNQCGYGSGWPKSMRIRIRLAKINADPDPAGQNQCGCGSGWPKSMRIRIRLAKVNADPNPAGQSQCGSGSGRPKSMRILIRLAKVKADPDPAG
jgi:hypothetical protein